MTETTPRVTACLDCKALIPASAEDRRTHREWHADLIAKHRGVQKKIAELAETVSKTSAGLSDLRRDVDNTEIPEPVDPLVIEDWPDDEINDLDQLEADDTLDDDEQDDPEPVTVTPHAQTYDPITGLLR